METKIKNLILGAMAIQTGLVALTLHTIGRVVKDIQSDFVFRLFAAADLATLIFSCIIMLAFMTILNKKLTFYKANLYVYLIVIANVMVFTVSQLKMPSPGPQTLILIIYGIATAAFAAKVIKCPDDLGGLKKPIPMLPGFPRYALHQSFSCLSGSSQIVSAI